MSESTDHPNCEQTKAVVINGTYTIGCKRCLPTTTHSADYAAKYTRDRMKEDNRKDIVQRYNGDEINQEWVKLHTDKAKEALGDQAVEDILRK
ncbi:MAG: hypothetical protein H0X02_05730 [Nitrosomonas sp.]|nr:hypothetical protein [Nitrosomonas sp.]